MSEDRLPSIGAALRAWGWAAAMMARAAPGPALATAALAVVGGVVPAAMALASGRMVDALVRVARSGATGGDVQTAGAWMAAVLLLVAYEREAYNVEPEFRTGPTICPGSHARRPRIARTFRLWRCGSSL